MAKKWKLSPQTSRTAVIDILPQVPIKTVKTYGSGQESWDGGVIYEPVKYLIVNADKPDIYKIVDKSAGLGYIQRNCRH